MNKNRKYILIAIIASLLLTVSMGFSVWIILSEQASSEHGYFISKIELTEANVTNLTVSSTAIYAGEDVTISAESLTYTQSSTGRTFNIPFEIEYDTLTTTFTGGTAPTGPLAPGTAVMTVTLRPTGFASLLFGSVEQTVNLSVYPVAQLGSTYYTTIDAALVAVQSATSGTVYVIPSVDYTNFEDPETGRARFAKTITPVYDEEGKEVPRVIPSGVTICVPYAYDSSTSTYSETLMVETTNNGALANVNAYSNPGTYCKNILRVAATVTVNGPLDVRGIYYSSEAKQLSGQTCGNYGSVEVVNGGKLTLNGKDSFVFGFIENKTNSYENLHVNSATLEVPFVFYEWPSGNNIVTLLDLNTDSIWSLLNLSDGNLLTSPILRFIFPNMVGKYRISAGAEVIAFATADFSSQDKQLAEEISMISTSESTFIQLYENSDDPGSASYMDIHYDPTVSTDGVFGTMRVHFYNGAKINDFSFTVDAASMLPSSISGILGAIGDLSITIGSNGKFLPIPYFYDIYFHASAKPYDVSGQDVKLLPGSSVTVEQGATLNAASLLIYDGEHEVPLIERVKVNDKPYASTEPAKLIVNGVLNVAGGVGGEIQSTAATGQVNINGALSAREYELIKTVTGSIGTDADGVAMTADRLKTTTESPVRTYVCVSASGTTFGGYATYERYELPLNLPKYSNAEESYNAKGTYYAKQIGSTTSYAWYPANFDVTLDTQGGTLSSTVENPYPVTITVPGQSMAISYFNTNTKPTRNYYTFNHWCTNSACTNHTNCSSLTASLYDDTTLYAIWTVNSYKLQYKYVLPNGDVIEPTDTDLAGKVIDFTIETDLTLKSPESLTKPDSTYTCAGWFNAPSGGSIIADPVVESCAAAAAANGGTAVIYARWQSVFYRFEYDFGDKYPDLGYTYASGAYETQPEKYNPLTDNATLNTVVTSKDGYSTTNKYYFVNWYLNEECTTPYDPETYAFDPTKADNQETATVIKLYAGWALKANVTIDYTDSKNNDSLTNRSDLWVKPGGSFPLAEFVASNALLTANDNDLTKSTYFNGWSATNATIDGANVTVNSGVETATVEAQWLSKNTLVIKWNRVSYYFGIQHRSAIDSGTSSSIGNYTFKSDANNAGETTTLYVKPHETYDMIIYPYNYNSGTLHGKISSIAITAGNGSLSGTTSCAKETYIDDLYYTAGDATTTTTVITITGAAG